MKLKTLLKKLVRYSLIVLVIQSLSLTLLVAGESSAQPYESVKNVVISIDLRDATLLESFRSIENQTDFIFTFDDKYLKENRARINFRKSNTTVEEVLLKISEVANLNFKRINNTISLNDVESENSVKSIYEVNLPQQTITGKVTSEDDGSTIPGVTVLVEGTSGIGTITDANGEYSINVPDGNTVLIYSYLGFVKQEVEVGNRLVIDIRLTPDLKSLEEVVVVGYAEVEKVSLTNSVASIQGQDLAKRTTSNISQSLQGKLPGLRVVDSGDGPGRSNMVMRVRGTTTIGNNEPLVIVDGIEQNLADINPQDIESVSVLKDASAAAIYGSRAANGVILVKTKSAKAGEIKGSYQGYYALQQSNNLPEHMGLEDYFRLQNTAWTNSSGSPLYTEAYIQEYVNATDRLKYPLPNTWYDAVVSNAPQVSNNISLSGGTESLKSRLSVRNFYQDGIIPNTKSNLWEVRLNNNFKISEKIDFGLNVNYRQKKWVTPYDEYPVWRWILRAPFTVPRYPDGTLGIGDSGQNPLVYAEKEGTADHVDNTLVTDFRGNWEIIDGLKLSAQYAVYQTQNSIKAFRDKYEIRDYYDPNIVKKNQTITELRETRNFDNEYTFNGVLTYNKTFGNHGIGLLAGYSQIKHLTNNLNAYRRGFYNNDIQSISAGADDNTKNNGGSESSWGLRSYFGRVNYSFDDKYLLEANARFDGSSRFTGDNLYSFFPSISGAWRISQEEFWNGLQSTINELKLRASIGQTGNQAVPLYSYYPNYSNVTYVFNNTPVTGYEQQALVNENLTWETTTQIDIGIDVAFIDDSYYLNFDYYNKQTEGMLLTLPIPGLIGLNPSPQNAGRVDNKGFELLIGTRKFIGDFGINANINFNYNENEVIDLAGTGPYFQGNGESRNITQEGLPIYTLWGYKTDGLFQSQAEIDNYPTLQPNWAPGDVKYLDLNNDGVINSDDATNLGQSVPKIFFGSDISMSYKGFTLNLLFQGVSGVKTRLGGPMNQMGVWDGFTHKLYTDDYWTPENPGARFPRPLKYDGRNDQMADFQIYDGSYLRLKNLQLVYEIPADFLGEKLGLSRIQVYAATTNLLTFSKLNEWNIDPETTLGARTEAYPQTSLTTFGINIDF